MHPTLATARKSVYAGLLCLYIVLAWAFSSISPQAHISSLWPSAGVALAGCMVFGQRFLPAVFIGSLLFHLTQQNSDLNADFSMPVIIAAGSALQAWVNYRVLHYRGLDTVDSPEYSQVVFFILSALCCNWINTFVANTALSLTSASAMDWNMMSIWWIGDFLGVLLITPLLLSLLLKQPDNTTKINQIKWLALPLLLSVIVLQSMQQYIASAMSAKTQSEFMLKAKVAENSLKRDMNAYLDSLNQLGAELTRLPVIHKAQFAQIVSRLSDNLPGLKAMSWNPLLTQPELPVFLEHARTHIDPDFRLKGSPIQPDDPLVIVQLIEPLEQNRSALGFNVFSHKDRKQSMLHATATHRATATNIIQLVQSDKQEPGLLIFVPVYHNADAMDASISGYQYLEGFAVGVFLVPEMLKRSVLDEDVNFIDLYIYENNEPASSVYGNPNIVSMIEANEGLKYIFHMRFANHHWTFNLHINSEQVTAFRISHSLHFLLIKAVFGSLAVFIILTAFGRNSYLLELVSSRTHELVKLNEKLEHFAFYDSLTGLPNRRLFMDRMQHALALARRDRHNIALLYMDLNRFKQVNDTLGHEVGDLLLKEVASRLSSTLRSSDTLARVGGDEFTLLIENNPDTQTLQIVVDKLTTSLQPAINAPGQALTASISIGVAVFPQDADSLAELMRAADEAMYQAKQRGQNSCFYPSVARQQV